MKRLSKKIEILFSFLFFINCNAKVIKVIKESPYELRIAQNQKAVLILFPCFSCNIENTKNEARFLENIQNEGVTTILLNYNSKLYLSDLEKNECAEKLNSIFDIHKVVKESVFIGGFSSGGNLAIILSNYLIKTKNEIQPKGAFVVDSPLDLEKLYKEAINDIKKNFSLEAVKEGIFLMNFFEKQIGKPSENIENYKTLSPYLTSCDSKVNIEYLKNIKIRFYCEPDLEWYMKNKKRNYEELNAFQLKKTYYSLLKLGAEKAELIKTVNRGIDANGNKRPHSWNIVEKQNLLKWMLD